MVDREIQARRELLNALQRARELLPANPAETIRRLETLSATYPRRADIRALLDQARVSQRAAELARLIAEADALSAKDKFTEALAKLTESGDDTADAIAARQRIEGLREAALARRVATAIGAARELKDRNPRRALGDLEKLRDEVPGWPEVGQAIEELRGAVRASSDSSRLNRSIGCCPAASWPRPPRLSRLPSNALGRTSRLKRCAPPLKRAKTRQPKLRPDPRAACWFSLASLWRSRL